MCVASDVEGRLTLNGQPAVGARVVRKVNWKDQTGESEETVTDEAGRFSLPARWDVLRRALPAQFVAHQSIIVHYQGQEYQIWGTGKLETTEYSEFGGKPENFRCELTDDLRRVDLDYGFVATICRWEHAEEN